jgi:hypothetical protein
MTDSGFMPTPLEVLQRVFWGGRVGGRMGGLRVHTWGAARPLAAMILERDQCGASLANIDFRAGDSGNIPRGFAVLAVERAEISCPTGDAVAYFRFGNHQDLTEAFRRYPEMERHYACILGHEAFTGSAPGVTFPTNPDPFNQICREHHGRLVGEQS